MIRLTVQGFLILTLWLTASLCSATQCGFNTTNLKGTINGPLGSGGHQTYAFGCTWTITAPDTHRIKLKATSFNLPGHAGSCGNDYVLIESLWGIDQVKNHGKFCGSAYPPEILSRENILRINYRYKGYSYNYRENSVFSFSHTAEHHVTAHYLVGEWMKNNTQKFFERRDSLPRIIAAMYLYNESYFGVENATVKNLTTEYRLHLAGYLVRNATHPLTAVDLSHHVTALMALCSNPRSFYGVNLVEHLRTLVNKKEGLLNPYYLLTLCNAGDKMTASDVRTLKLMVEVSERNMFWLDFRAMALMALVCVNEGNKSFDTDMVIRQTAAALKNHQLTDGSFGSLQTTSLVVQALTAAETIVSGWNKTSAIDFVESLNNSDGSFGNLYNLYSAIPVISYKTLLHLNSSRCNFNPEGLTPLEEIQDKLAEPIHVFYSLWIGDQVDFSYTITLKVPNGTKFLDFMRLAAKADEKFQLKWKYVNGELHIFQIYSYVNDPASGKYWTLLTGTDMIKLKPYSKGLETYVPEDGDVVVMWYKTMVVKHPWNEIDVKSANLSTSFEQ